MSLLGNSKNIESHFSIGKFAVACILDAGCWSVPVVV